MENTCFEEKGTNKNNSLLGTDKNKKINSLSFELSLKFFFDKEDGILSVHEISNNRIGILSLKLLSIYSLKTFSKIDQIDYGNKNKKLNIFKDFNFLELKNFDLVLWTNEFIYLYKLCNKKYILYQKIYEISQIEKDINKVSKFFDNDNDKYRINSIYELSNGNIISCENSELNIYHRNNIQKNDKYEYILLSIHELFNVKHIIELNSNKLILLKRYFSPNTWRDADHSYNEYSISIYNIKNYKEKKITKIKINSYEYDGISEISYLIKNNYLLIRYGYKLDIYNIKNNMKLIHTEKEKIVIKEAYGMIGKYNRSCKTLEDEMNVIFFSDYFDDLFIVKDFKRQFKVYKFNNKKMQFYKDFSFQDQQIIGIIKLKNNNTIIYSHNELYVYKNK